MNVLEINTVNCGSTGNIMLEIADLARKKGHNVWVAFPKYKINLSRSTEHSIIIGDRISFWIHSRIFRYFGFNGCGSFLSTLMFLRKIDKLRIDLVHLHNLHDCYINFPLLFAFLKKKKISIIWTLHDCWPFTGKCAHYDMIGCQKWENGCEHCPQIHVYPSSGLDRTRLMWKLKRKVFCGIPQMLLIAPSHWLKEQVKKSFLGHYPIIVINNGIDLSIFRRQESTYNFGVDILGKYIILGVAFGWNEKKGLDVFVELAKRLNKAKYQIVLVGTTNAIENQLPNSIISIPRTNNKSELATIYSSADVFVNPTREEVLGLVNLESLACGTPVITFDSGGSPECVDETCGCVIKRNNIDLMENEIKRICEDKPYSREACVRRAHQFNKNDMLNKYIKIYEELYEG